MGRVGTDVTKGPTRGGLMRMEGATVVLGRAILVSGDCQCWRGRGYLSGLPARRQILLLQSSGSTPRDGVISLGQLI
jgi:hypothetical protein